MDELSIAPPALMRQVQEAERLLGARLFHPTKRSVALTAAGEAYLGEATRALEHLTRAAERAALAERGELGCIVIGYVASAVYSGVLQATVRDFLARYPRVEIGISARGWRAARRRAHRHRLCAAAGSRCRRASRRARCIAMRSSSRYRPIRR